MKPVLPILAMMCTAGVTLMAVVFTLAMGANAKPPEIRALRLWTLGLPLLALMGIGAGIFLLRTGQPGWAAGVSIAPAVIMMLILIVTLLK
jgi:hypothetical protein